MKDIIIKIIEVLSTISVTLISVWAKGWIDARKKGDDLNEDFDLKSKVRPILEEVRYELGADRVQYCVFSNGDVTLTGHHLKKLSVLVESNKEGCPDIAHFFQLIPTRKFERNLDAIYESADDYVLTNEFEQHDELGFLYSQFKIKVVLNIKITNNVGKWIGIMSVMFNDESTVVADSEISFCKLEAARLGTIK